MAQQRARRLELHTVLVGVLGSDYVYFQPPPTVQMKYPCIIYKRDSISVDHADNSLYKDRIRYLLTVVDTDPDSEIHSKIRELPLCSYERFYTAENLNHDVYNLYF